MMRKRHRNLRSRLSTGISVGFTVLLMLAALPARAVLTIDVTQGVDRGIPIAIVPFKVTPAQALPESVWDIIEADLGRSGRFEPVPRGDFLNTPHTPADISYKNWRLLKANALVIGQVRQLDAERYEVEYRLMDVFKEGQMTGNKYTVKRSLLRKVAHKIADEIYEKMTGIPGAFDTKIAYVTKVGTGANKRFNLKVSDSDGYRPLTILESKEPIMSPAWSPEAGRLAYVSFEKRRSMIYVQDLRTGQRQAVAEYPRINSSPAWSPDGNRLAMALSKDGNVEVYVKDLRTGALNRLTRHSAIDTEPSFTPDGRYILFTSGRASGRQIYRVPAAGGPAQRVTFHGRSNAAPALSPDGSKMLLITDLNGGDKVGIYDAKTRNIVTLTNGRLDDSPSFAPNGAMILYSSLHQGRKVLAAVSSDGRVQQVLRLEEGEVREPAWSPKLP